MRDKKTTEFLSDPDKIAEGFLSQFIFDPNPNSGGDFEAGNAHYSLQYHQGQFYRWNEGVYIKVSQSELKLLIKQHLHALNAQPEVDQIRISSHLVGNIILCIAGMDGVHIPEARRLNTWDDGREKLYQTICFRNGLLLFGHRNEEPKLFPHTPKFFSTVQLPYDYDPDATYIEWEDFLLDVMDGDAERVTLLQQWAGYLLTNNLRQQKFLLVAGEGANGKNTVFEIIERMVGRDNCTHIPLAQFGKPFVLATTIGKIANLSSENHSAIDAFGETVLKAYTAGDAMSFQRKYLDSVEVIPTAKIMIATNQLPKFQDKTQGVWRRLLFIPFEKVFSEKEQNKNLADELSKGLPGIFNWALKGMESLQEAGMFIRPAKCQAAIKDYMRAVNPARAFLQDNYSVDVEAEGLPCREVYATYVAWCKDNGCKCLNSANFGKEVKRVLGVEKVRYRNEQTRTNRYAGLTVKIDTEINDEISNPDFQAKNDD